MGSKLVCCMGKFCPLFWGGSTFWFFKIHLEYFLCFDNISHLKTCIELQVAVCIKKKKNVFLNYSRLYQPLPKLNQRRSWCRTVPKQRAITAAFISEHCLPFTIEECMINLAKSLSQDKPTLDKTTAKPSVTYINTRGWIENMLQLLCFSMIFESRKCEYKHFSDDSKCVQFCHFSRLPKAPIDSWPGLCPAFCSFLVPYQSRTGGTLGLPSVLPSVNLDYGMRLLKKYSSYTS